jgi:hypothetical protein
MVKMCVTPEKVGNDMRFFDVVEAPGNSRAGAVPTSGSCGSFLGESILVSASGTSSSAQTEVSGAGLSRWGSGLACVSTSTNLSVNALASVIYQILVKAQ